MNTYYWEGQHLERHGDFTAESDEEAIKRAEGILELVCLYRESDTEDGLPFIDLIVMKLPIY